MTQKKFEDKIMDKILDGDNELLQKLKKQYIHSQVNHRELSGVGFFVDFTVPDNLSVDKLSGRIDDVGATYSNLLNSQLFILWVRDGKISTLEGTAIGDSWFDKYDEAIFSYNVAGQRVVPKRLCKPPKSGKMKPTLEVFLCQEKRRRTTASCVK